MFPKLDCSKDPPDAKTHKYNYYFTEGSNNMENKFAQCLECGLVITIPNVGKYYNAEEVE
jgi:hypothetical protein